MYLVPETGYREGWQNTPLQAGDRLRWKEKTKCVSADRNGGVLWWANGVNEIHSCCTQPHEFLAFAMAVGSAAMLGAEMERIDDGAVCTLVVR